MANRGILAIDQGTTSTRSVVYDAETLLPLAASQKEIRQYFPQDGWVEHDAEEIWRTVAETVQEAMRQSGVEPQKLVGIGITNQRETVVVWERATGRAVHRAIVWQDRRTTGYCQQHASAQPFITAKTGLFLDPYFSATKIRWLLDYVDHVRSAGESGQLAAGTIDTFLLWRLTGGQVHGTDVTNAARTLLFDIHALQWDHDLLRFFGIPAALLPQVRPSVSDFGVTRGLDFLPDGIPIHGIAGDQQAALYGQGCFAAGESKCTYGTGAFYLLHTGQKAVTSHHKLLTTVAAMCDATPKYALEGAVFIAGAAVQWLRDGLHLFRKAAEVEQLAASSREEEPVICVPGFVGLGAPHWEPAARGAILGLTRATTAADLARAVLEGVALQVVDLVEAAVRDWSGTPEAALAPLSVDGGMAKNAWFLQRQADLLGRPVVQAGQIEATAQGAAFLAAVGAGLTDEAALRQHLHVTARFEPKWTPQQRAHKRRIWRRAVDAVLTFARSAGDES
jgi:glycerol kinase